MKLEIYIFSILFLKIVTCFKILIYSPRMMASHVNFMATIANLLAENGHEVTVIDSIFRNDIENGLGPRISNVLKIGPSPLVTEMLKSGNLPTILWNSRAHPDDQRDVMEGLGQIHAVQCLHFLENSTIIEQVQQITFDFGIHEVFDSCGIGILEAINIDKTVIVSSTTFMDAVPWALGVSDPLKVSSLLSDYGSEIDIWNVRRNLKFTSAMLNFHEIQEKTIREVFRRKYGVEENLFDIMRKASLLFINTHEMSAPVQMWGRRIYEIGGIALRDGRELDEEYQSMLNTSKPVVLISFGTAATSDRMPSKLKNSILKALKLMPDVFFIWKYEKLDDFVKNNENLVNVAFRKYTPQVDLLNSGKISLFLTHCGQNSLLENFQSGTKALAVPIFGDQHRNARSAKEHGLLDILPKESLSDPKKIVKVVRDGLKSKGNLKLLGISKILRERGRRDAEKTLLFALGNVQKGEDFSNFPRFYHPDRWLMIIDTCLSVFFAVVLYVIVFKFIINIM